eukprot:809410-Prorocentrum_minimum.AAC.1
MRLSGVPRTIKREPPQLDPCQEIDPPPLTSNPSIQHTPTPLARSVCTKGRNAPRRCYRHPRDVALYYPPTHPPTTWVVTCIAR